MTSRRSTLVGIALAAALTSIATSPANAERAWIKDEVKLNIRTGPGVQFRILGLLGTGDSIEIITRGDGWTQVRGKDGMEGWIPMGFLQADPPARIQLERHQAETAEMRNRFDKISDEVKGLRAENESLATKAASHGVEIERLTRENLELRAGARWPEWIAGASILFVGAVLGMIIHRSASRRPSPRIRI